MRERHHRISPTSLPANKRNDPETVTEPTTRENDVRQALVRSLSRRITTTSHLLVPEVDIRWSVPARIDLLLVSDKIHGFEIKSDSDSLARLHRQVDAYNAVVQRAIVVVGARHIEAVWHQVPIWWAVWTAKRLNDQVVIKVARMARSNPNVDPLAVTSFMSRAFIVEALRNHGVHGLSALPVDSLREELVARLGPRATIRLARQSMIQRRDWQNRSLLSSESRRFQSVEQMADLPTGLPRGQSDVPSRVDAI